MFAQCLPVAFILKLNLLTLTHPSLEAPILSIRPGSHREILVGLGAFSLPLGILPRLRPACQSQLSSGPMQLSSGLLTFLLLDTSEYLLLISPLLIFVCCLQPFFLGPASPLLQGLGNSPSNSIRWPDSFPLPLSFHCYAGVESWIR